MLLTACIDTKDVIATARSDHALRLSDYKLAFGKYITHSGIKKLIFCENSGYDMSELKAIYANRNRNDLTIEFLSFYGQDFSPHLGKGYGEMNIVKYALDNSKLISEHSILLKVTGRYYVKNIDNLIRGISQSHDVDVFCDLRQNLSSSDSRVFAGTLPFLKDYLLPLQATINDSKGICLENCLAMAICKAISDERRWSLLPVAHWMFGTSASNNTTIASSRITYLKRELFRKIKAFLLAR